MLGPLALVGGIAALAYGVYYANAVNRVRLQTALEQAQAAFTAGDYDRVLQIVEGARQYARREPTHRAMLLLLHGSAQRMRGDLERAAAALEDAASIGHATHASRIFAELASVYGLRGELDRARSTLDKARTQVRFDRVADHAQVTEAIVALRSGEPARAAQLLTDVEPRLERVLPAPHMKTIYLLLAFALASDRGTRESGAAVHALTRARGIDNPSRLTNSWPELQTFVETELK